MKTDSLPRQIVLLVSAVLLAVLALLWTSLYSIRQAMDAEALQDSIKRIDGRISTIQGQVALIASDYHNWTDLYLASIELDLNKLSSNYGITAARGDVFQYAELFDGPFANPLSWSVGLGLKPQDGVLSIETREKIRKNVIGLDTTSRKTFDFFSIQGGEPIMFSASFLLPEELDMIDSEALGSAAIAAIGKVLKRETFEKIENEFLVSNLRVSVNSNESSGAAIALYGVDGQPTGWLKWEPPVPGTQLFWKMFPIMAVVSLTFVAILHFAAHYLRNRAVGLIEREAISFSDARYDSLTGLPNRLALREHLEKNCTTGDTTCAAFAIDLVGFKQINDTVGHMGGDIFLKEFSARLSKLADEHTFVSRCGGDEFLIFVSSAEDINQHLRNKYSDLEAISRSPIDCCGIPFSVLSSKGIAVRRNGSISQGELLRRADRAMYTAKLQNTQDIVVYDAEMESADLENKRIEKELRKDISLASHFEILYQPIIGTEVVKSPVRYEALARWTSPVLGKVSPEKFISVAETSGLINSLGWVLLDIILDDMVKLPNVHININVSPSQLASHGFARSFSDRVAAKSICSSRIQIEVTEQVLARNEIAIAREVEELSMSGFSLALDDFGTGYSSLGYITKMPFNTLKIDRSFVSGIRADQSRAKIVKSIMGIGSAMDLQIVVEGVECPADFRFLKSMGVNFFQGYLFGKPSLLRSLSFGVDRTVA